MVISDPQHTECSDHTKARYRGNIHIFTTKEFLEVAIENLSEWDLKP